MQKGIKVTGVNIVFFVFVAVYIFFQIILGVLSVVFGPDFIENSIYGILLINQYVLILIPVLIYIVIKGESLKRVLRFNKLRMIPALLIVVISIPAYFVAAMLNTIVVYLLQFIGDIPPQPLPVPRNTQELIVAILIIAVTPAICEEVMHRGLFMSAYEKRGSIKAVVITAVFFGFFHFDITNLLGPIFLGLLIGYYVLRTNSIFAGMLAHFVNNSIAVLLQFYIGKNEASPEKITVLPDELGYITILGVSAALFVFILIKMFRHTTRDTYVLTPPISNIRRDIISIISHWPIIVIAVIYFLVTVLYFLTIVAERHINMLK